MDNLFTAKDIIVDNIDIAQTPEIKSSGVFSAKDIEPFIKNDPSKGDSKSVADLTYTVPYQKSFENLKGNPLITPSNLKATNEQIASEQSGWDLTKSVTNRAIFGEIIGGTIEGLGTVMGWATGDLKNRIEGTEDAFSRNFLEELGAGIQESVRDDNPIYLTQNAQNNLALDDATWWANLIPSVASALSMLIPATGVAKGLGLVGKLGEAGLAARGIGKAGKIMEATGKSAWEATTMLNRARAIKGVTTPMTFATQILAPAIVSRNLDSTREALNRYTTTYETLKETYDDATAKRMAGEAAHYGYLTSHANLAFDIIEWTALFKMTNNISKAVKGRVANSLLDRTAIQEILGTNATNILGGTSKFKAIVNKLPAALKVGLMEGFDETTMDFFMNEGERYSKIKNNIEVDDSTSMFGRYLEHHTVAKNYESFIGGFLGGVSMTGAMKGGSYLYNKYKGNDDNSQIENIATSFEQRSKNTQETLQRINNSVTRGKATEAIHLRNNLISTIATESAAQGTLDLDIQMLENISKLSKDERAKLEFLKDIDFDNETLDLNSIVSDLKDISKIYSKELKTIRNADENDSLISLQIAKLKTDITLNNKSINKLKVEGDITPETIDNQTYQQLENLNENASIYYDKLNEKNNQLSLIDKQKQSLEQNKDFINFENVKLEDEIKDIENQLSTLDENSKLAKDLKYKLTTNKNAIKLNETRIETRNNDIAKLEKDITIVNENFDLFDNTVVNTNDFKAKVQDIYDATNVSKEYAGTKGVIGSLEQTNFVLQKEIDFWQTKEGYKTMSKIIDNNKQKEIANILADFETIISDKEYTDEELESKFEEFIKLNKLDKDTIKKLKSKIEDKKAENATINKTAEDLETAIDTKVEVISEVEEDNVEPIVTETSPAESSTSSPTRDYENANGETIKVGDYVYVKLNTDTVKFNIPLQVIRINDEIGTVVLSIDLSGNQQEYEVSLNEVTNFYNGEIIANDITKINEELFNAIKENSDKIGKNEKTHTYTLEEQEAQITASQLTKTVYSDNKTNNAVATNVGNNIDNAIRDFFNPDIDSSKSANKYKIPQEEYVILLNTLNDLKRNFDIAELRVISTNVKVFDKETGVAGEMDLVLIDKDNNIHIYDVKTNKLDKNDNTSIFENKRTKYGDYNAFKSYIAQLNIYANLLSKQFPNAKVTTLGILPISVNYNKAGLITKVQPMQVTLENLNTAEGLNNGSIVNYNNGVITFNQNPTILDIESIIEGKTVNEVLNVTKPENVIEVVQQLDNETIANNVIELIDLFNKYSDNIVIANLSSKFTGLFDITNVNGKNQITVKNIDPELKSILLEGYNSLSDYFYALYTNNASELNNMFSTTVLGNNTVFGFFNNTIKHLNTIYANENNINNIYNGMNGTVNSESLDVVYDRLNDVRSEIVRTINNIIESRKRNSTEGLITDMNYYLSLLDNIVFYKKLSTFDNTVKISVSDAIKIIKDSFENTESELGYEDLLEIYLGIPNILNFIKNDFSIRQKYLINKERENIKLQLESGSIVFDSETNSFKSKDDEGNLNETYWSNTDDQIRYNVYKNISDNIIVDSKKTYGVDYIDNILAETINKSSNSYNHFLTEINQELIEEPKDGLVEENGIYNIIHEIRNGDEVSLRKNDKGDIELYYGNMNKPLSVMPNLKESIKGIKMTNENGFVGISEIIKNNKFLNEILFNKIGEDRTIDILKKMYEYKLLSTTTNRPQSVINHAVKSYKDLVDNIINNDISNNIYSNIQEVVDAFMLLNKSEIEQANYVSENNLNSNKYSKENIDNILDILFFNRYLDFIEDYVPTEVDTINRLNYFNLVSSKNYNQFVNLDNLFETSEQPVASITDISKPSIKTRANSKKQKSLVDTIKPTKLKSDGSSNIQIINKRGNIVDARTGETINSDLLSLSNKKDGFYVAIESTNGKLSPFPVKATRLKNSYTKVRSSNYEVNGSDLSEKAVNHVSTTLFNTLFNGSDSDIKSTLVGNRVKVSEEVFEPINSDSNVAKISIINNNIKQIIEDSKLKNIVITLSSDGKSNNYPYLESHAFKSDSGFGVDKVIRCTTMDKDNNGKNITTYHKFIVQGGVFYHYSTDNSNYEGLDKLISDLHHKKTTTTDYKNKFTFIDVDGKVIPSQIDNIFKVIENVSGNLLRQTHYGENKKIDFGTSKNKISSETFEDPITGDVYTSAVDHALYTDSIYSDVDGIYSEVEGEKTIVSNLNLNGASKVRFSVDVNDVTSIKKGELKVSPLDKIRSSKMNVPFKEIISVIDMVNDKLKEDYEIIETHTGVETDENIIAQVKASTVDNKLVLDYKYTDLFIHNLNNSNIVDNPIVGILHEHIHSIIMSSMNFSKLSNEQKRSIAKDYNTQMLDLLNNLEKDFNNFIYKDNTKKEFNIENINKLKEGFNFEQNNTVINIIQGFIFKSKTDLIKANTNLDKGLDVVDSSVLGQEIFTYFTNPFIMSVLSKIQPSDSNSIELKQKTFIDKLIDALMSIYNNIVNILGTSYDFKITNENYTKNVRNLLSNLYYDLGSKDYVSKVTDNLNEQTIDNNEDIDLDDTDIFNVESLDISNINAIFTTNAKEIINHSFKDNENKKIC